MDSYTPIAYLQPGKKYNGIFLVRDVSVRSSFKNKIKKSYLLVHLIDVTGTIEGAIWSCTNPSLVEAGKYIVLEIEVKEYNGKLQFNASGKNIQVYSGTPPNIQDYVRGPAQTILDFYATELKDRIDEVDDPDYRDIILKGVDLVDILKNSPYGERGPLIHPGGLLIHTVHTLRLSLQAAEQCKEIDGLKINKSLLVLGATLRNIGWHTTTILEGGFFKPRDAFHMTGVYRASARYVDHLMLSTENDLNKTLSESKKQALHNMCNPLEDIKTAEGKIVAWAGELASLMHLAGTSMTRKPEGSWCGEFFVGHH